MFSIICFILIAIYLLFRESTVMKYDVVMINSIYLNVDVIKMIAAPMMMMMMVVLEKACAVSWWMLL